MHNCVLSTKKILQLLGVKHTTKFIKDSILSHPNHPSLLCISDTLVSYNINVLSIKVNDEKLKELPLPCVVQVKNQGVPLFYTLAEYSNDRVVYYNDKNNVVESSKELFMSEWTGVCLLVEKNETSKEPDIEKKSLGRKITYSSIIISLIVLLAWITLLIFNTDTIYLLPVSLISLLKIAGITVSVFLLWFEVDQYNPALQSFCSGGRKVNCKAVLNSKYSSIFNTPTPISLSSITFAYFFSSIVYMMINRFEHTSLGLLSTLSFITIPVVVISVYYQAYKIKNWCKFCLMIQAILLLEVITGLLFKLYMQPVKASHLLLYMGLFLIPIVGWMHLKPLLDNAKESNLYKRNLAKIKNNTTVFESLLSKTNKIKNNTYGLGIHLKRENARYNVIKVCNPYCGPCAEAHPILEALYKNGSIDLQIIFAASPDKNDYRTKPVNLFLAIDSKKDDLITQQALDKWYLSKNKDFDQFSKQYNFNGELKQQWDKIKAMDQWCKAENINHTPTIFINGHELPKEYSVNDLKEILQ